MVTFFLFLSGCTPRQQFVYDYHNMDSAPAFTLSDERPASEKTAEVLSINVMNDNYGIYRIGDTQLTPDRITYLSNRLSSKASSQLSGSNIVVKHFEIHNNLQKLMKQSASFGIFGLTGGLLAGVIDNPDALIDVKITLGIDHKSFSTHVIHGYRVEKWEGATDKVVAVQIHEAMNEAVEQIVAKL